MIADWTSEPIQATAAFGASGITLGFGSRLVRFDKRSKTLALVDDRERCLALIAVATRAPVDPDTLLQLEAAATYWDRGDKALANLRLVFSGLPRLRDATDAARLRAAEYLLDHGMTPYELLRELEIDPAPIGLRKYDPDQPRVPAGQGKESGRWWSGLSHWLQEEVPVYDTDTGDEVGTQSRGRAIATNPLTIAAAGTAAFFAAEAAAATLAVGAAEETVTPFAARYLSTSGGSEVRRHVNNCMKLRASTLTPASSKNFLETEKAQRNIFPAADQGRKAARSSILQPNARAARL